MDCDEVYNEIIDTGTAKYLPMSTAVKIKVTKQILRGEGCWIREDEKLSTRKMSVKH